VSSSRDSAASSRIEEALDSAALADPVSSASGCSSGSAPTTRGAASASTASTPRCLLRSWRG